MEEINQKQFKVTEDLLVKIDKRIFNFIVDVIMLSILLFIGLIIYVSNLSINEGKEFINRFLTNNILQYTVSSGVTLIYYNLMEISTSRTIGKFCTNTIVVDQNGDSAGYEAIMIRSLVRIIPLYWISFLLFPTRGLHDVVSKTYVVNKNVLEEKKKQFYALQQSTNNE